MDMEERISAVERITVRVAAYISLLFILIAVLLYGAFELIKFVAHSWPFN